MYHTQEKRAVRLTAPIICTRPDAWLGDGYYFWEQVIDARFWGHSSKTATGYFEVYSADIDLAQVLDTVFNREHYEYWVKEIEKIASSLQAKSSGNTKPTIRQINNYIREKGLFSASSITGILFQDNTNDPRRIKVEKFEYKKRIQLAAFTTRIISNFSFQEEQMCR